MSNKPRILAFAGATREGSLNKKLVRIAAEGARQAGAEVTTIDLGDYPLPIYDGDFESAQGLPANAKKLKQLMESHDGLLISSPEYNSSLPAVLKNVIDWASRKADPDEASLSAFAGKGAAIMSVSPGGLGGIRGLVHLRSILGNIQVLVLPDQKTIPHGVQAFDDDGTLKDPRQQAAVSALGAKLTAMLGKLKA